MYEVDFDTSINIDSKEYEECIKCIDPKYLRSMPKKCSPKDFIIFIKKLYSQNNLSKIKQQHTFQIPAIIHQIWLGDNLPSEYLKFQKSWRYNHPNWNYIYWTKKEFDINFSNGFYNQKLFDQSYNDGNYAKAADIARYEILYKFGGLYVDCDTECFKSFDILNKTYSFYAGMEDLYNGLVIGNAIMGAKPNHPILKQCLLNIKKYENKNINFKFWKGLSGYNPKVEKEYAKTLVTTGPILFSQSIWKTIQNNDNLKSNCIIFPPTFFYPFGEYKEFSIKPETFACHYFKGVWKKNLKLKYESTTQNLLGAQ